MIKKDSNDNIIRKYYEHSVPKSIYKKGIENNNYLINYLFVTSHRNLSDVLIFTKKQLFKFHKVSNVKTKEQIIVDMENLLKEFALNKDDENINLNNYGLNDTIVIELDMSLIEYESPFGLISNYELKKICNYDGKTAGLGKILLFLIRHKIVMYKRSGKENTVENLPEISYFYKNRLAEELHMARGTIDSCIEVLENLEIIKTDKENFHKTYDGIIHPSQLIVTNFYANDEESTSDLELLYGKKYLDRKFFENDRERRINKEKKFLKKNKEI